MKTCFITYFFNKYTFYDKFNERITDAAAAVEWLDRPAEKSKEAADIIYMGELYKDSFRLWQIHKYHSINPFYVMFMRYMHDLNPTVLHGTFYERENRLIIGYEFDCMFAWPKVLLGMMGLVSIPIFAGLLLALFQGNISGALTGGFILFICMFLGAGHVYSYKADRQALIKFMEDMKEE